MLGPLLLFGYQHPSTVGLWEILQRVNLGGGKALLSESDFHRIWNGQPLLPGSWCRGRTLFPGLSISVFLGEWHKIPCQWKIFLDAISVTTVSWAGAVVSVKVLEAMTWSVWWWQHWVVSVVVTSGGLLTPCCSFYSGPVHFLSLVSLAFLLIELATQYPFNKCLSASYI